MINDEPDDAEILAALEPISDLVARILTLVETLNTRVEVLELEQLHRQPAADSMMEMQAGCTDAETSLQP